MIRWIALALLICGCSPAPEADDPIVVVMCADIDPGELHHPCCSGFVFEGQVITANHCVPDDTAELVTGKQWTRTANAYEIGTVTDRDEARDIAWLTAAIDSAGLERGAYPVTGAQVRALTRFGLRPGVTGDPEGEFWLTTMNTVFGDSGSAVLDSDGHVSGVLSRCLTADGKQCDPNTGIFAGLP